MSQAHWNTVYSTKSADSVSWFQPQAEVSLRLINALSLDKAASIIDVGGGASVLVDDLLRSGYTNLTVLDIAKPALKVAQSRLQDNAAKVNWLCADITSVELPAKNYQVWHDRAVFHFLTEPSQRAAYFTNLNAALREGGYVVISTFAPDGPLQCSGLPICRYSVDDLSILFDEFVLQHSENSLHTTPWGAMQSFVYAVFKKKEAL